jgi:hygromycin-B 4-O-kinase
MNADAAHVLALVHARFAADAHKLERLAGGEFSRAYGFTAKGERYVIRVSPAGFAAYSYAKDAYAADHFASQQLPIPKIVAAGESDLGAYAISQRAPGRRVTELTDADRRALLPALLDTLDAIGRADIAGTSGVGVWGADGNAADRSWRDHLAAAVANHEEGFYANWHALFETSFLERDLYERVYHRMLELAVRCPEERRLIHRDYHFDNVLTDGQRVTGVVDWGNAAYGDPLYDAAWVGYVFWKDYGIDAATPIRERDGDEPNFAARLACYELHVGLDDLRFFARTNREPQYRWTRAWLLARL